MLARSFLETDPVFTPSTSAVRISFQLPQQRRSSTLISPNQVGRIGRCIGTKLISMRCRWCECELDDFFQGLPATECNNGESSCGNAHTHMIHRKSTPYIDYYEMFWLTEYFPIRFCIVEPWIIFRYISLELNTNKWRDGAHCTVQHFWNFR